MKISIPKLPVYFEYIIFISFVEIFFFLFYDDVVINLSRAQVHFWITVDSDLNQTNATRTASTNNNDDTASLATVGALLALLKKHHQYKTQEKWIEEILKMKDAEFPHARALSESQMKKTFADANKALKDLKEQ